MKIGIDFHGVINKAPEFFSAFTQSMSTCGHEIHIVTGSKEKDIRLFLLDNKIKYTHFYSITNDLLGKHLDYMIDNKGNEVFAESMWNQAKALYCQREQIDMMIDDSDTYGRYFTTPYCKWEGIK